MAYQGMYANNVYRDDIKVKVVYKNSFVWNYPYNFFTPATVQYQTLKKKDVGMGLCILISLVYMMSPTFVMFFF